MKSLKTFLVAVSATACVIATTHSIGAKPIQPPPPPDYDIKSYPATACQPVPLDIANYSQGRICNPVGSTEDLNVFCPIVRDDVVEGDDTLVLVDIDQNIRAVECTAFSLDNGDDVIYENTRSVIQPAGEATITFVLEDTVPDGYYSLSCTLPPYSCIFGYRVYEWEDHDYEETTDYNR